MIATIPSATLLGVEGYPVAVEAHVSTGLPGFHVVGLPDAACRESRDRVRAALLSSNLPWPLRRVTVNLAPSGMRKTGAGLDLPIAIALLAAAGELPIEALTGIACIGELGLDGSVRPVPGILPLVDAVDVPIVVVPESCRREAALVGRHDVRAVATLSVVVDALRGDGPWPDASTAEDDPDPPSDPPPDLAEVRGQRVGRWALEVAAAGGHHLLMTGPPGAGKTLLAQRLPGILPPLTREQALETTRVHSAAGVPLPPRGMVERPPFRAPHHSASAVSLVGGGTAVMRPGERSCATNGVLFLDELGEFHAGVLDMLRQPLEEGVVRVSRARATVTFPARFLLVAAMNPCPCGRAGPPGACRCSETERARYARRVSGPLLDRFDLRVAVTWADPEELLGAAPAESSADVAARVASVRVMAAARGVRVNAAIPAERLDEVAPVTKPAWDVLDRRLRSGALTARGLHRVRRVARTLADLDGCETLDEEHVCAAMALRVDHADLGLAS
ncbi:MAG: YifB family Mg chelatase-like AAA ATPase [Actinobacteria bacterium]|nr:YifB family Mg chelatase-like AAA ATPase [Actinomycetota bacterium]